MVITTVWHFSLSDFAGFRGLSTVSRPASLHFGYSFTFNQNGKVFEKIFLRVLYFPYEISQLLEGHAFPVTSWPLKTEYTILQARNLRE